MKLKNLTYNKAHLCLNKNTSIENQENFNILDNYYKNVRNMPNQIFLIDDKQEYTFKEVDEFSDNVAKFLSDHNISLGDRVTIYGEKSVNSILLIIGIVKVGATYITPDKQIPIERLKYIIEDSDSKLVIHDGKIDKEICCSNICSIESVIRYKSNENTKRYNTFNNKEICVFYTSGSTGTPKGVSINPKGIARLTENTDYMNVSSKDKILQISSLAFDLSTFDIWMAINNGCQLIMFNKNEISKFDSVINKYNISIILTTPSILNYLIDYEENSIKKIKNILVGGEVISYKHINRLLPHFGEIIHIYGPTEATTFVTTYNIESKYTDNAVPIGKPFQYCNILICDVEGNLLKENELGEICIIGDALSNGYIGLKDSSFIELLINGEKKRLYKTGDYGYINNDFNLIFVRRKDGQIKVNGNRIELAEVKKEITSLSEIKEVHLTYTDKLGLLCFYTTFDTITPQEIQNKLKERLPIYMIPSYFFYYNTFPLNINGKVDNEKLINDIKDTNVYEDEELISWKIVNHYSDDKVFKNEVNSLNLMKIIGILKSKYQKTIEFKNLYKNPDFKTIKKYIKEYDKTIKLVSNNKTELTDIQKEMYFKQLLDDNNSLYNVITLLNFKSSINKENILKAIHLVIQKEFIFNATIPMENQPKFEYKKDKYHDQVYDLKLSTKEELKKLIKCEQDFCFDLSKELFHIYLVEVDKEVKLLININHIICDGISTEYFMEKIMTNYDLLENNNIENSLTVFDYKVTKDDSEHYSTNYRIMTNEKLSFEKNNGKGNVCDKVEGKISDKLLDTISKYSKTEKVTKSSIFLSAYLLVLNIFLEEDTQIGIPIIHDYTKNIRPKINVNVLKSDIYKQETMSSYIQSISNKFSDILDNSKLSYSKILNSVTNRKGSTDILYNFTFNFHNYKYYKHELIQNIERNLNNKIKEKLSLNIYNDYSYQFNFDSSLYNREYIDIIKKMFISVLTNIEEDYKIKDLIEKVKKVGDLKSVVYGEEKQYLYSSIEEKFYNIAAVNPSNIAVVYKERKYTYKDLLNYIESNINYIRKERIKSGTYIGIQPSNGVDFIIQVLTLWKHKCIVVPIDESKSLDNSFIDYKISEDPKRQHSFKVKKNKDYIIPQNNKKNICYVSYTSGSTGNSKIMEIEKKPLIDYILHLIDTYNLNSTIKTLQVVPISFDACLRDTFTTLLSGGQIIFPNSNKDIDDIISVITKYKINSIFSIIPSYLELIIDSLEKKGIKNDDFKYIMTSGEKMTVILFKKLKKVFPKTRYVNLYGPSECTLTTTQFEVNKQNVEEIIPAGKPIPNKNIYILNENAEIVSIGVVGDIWISGQGVVDGYLNKTVDEKTFSKIDNINAYKTGDIGYIDKNSNLIFIRRKNDEVKINGEFIDIQYIENLLNNLDFVDKTIISSRNNVLNIIVISKEIGDPNIIFEELKNIIKKVPLELYQSEKIILNDNGKIDYKKLLKNSYLIQKSKNNDNNDDSITIKVKKIYKDVGVPYIEKSSNFFSEGGSSLIALKIISHINKEFNVCLTFRDFYLNPTIYKISDFIKVKLGGN